MAKEEKSSGLRFISMFAIPPYSLGYCGSGGVSDDTFRSYIIRKDSSSENEIREEIKNHFRTLWPYLKALGKVLKVDPFSKVCADFYIHGIGDLSQVDDTEFVEELVNNLREQDYPDEMLASFVSKAPHPIYPSHTFHLILDSLLSYGNPLALDHINECMVKMGTVHGSFGEKNMVEVETVAFEMKDNKLSLKPYTVLANYDPELLGKKLKNGDQVVTHWDWVVTALTDKEFEGVATGLETVKELFNKKG